MAELTREMFDKAIEIMKSHNVIKPMVIPAPRWVIDKGLESGEIVKRDGKLYLAGTTHETIEMSTFN